MIFFGFEELFFFSKYVVYVADGFILYTEVWLAPSHTIIPYRRCYSSSA